MVSFDGVVLGSFVANIIILVVLTVHVQIYLVIISSPFAIVRILLV